MKPFPIPKRRLLLTALRILLGLIMASLGAMRIYDRFSTNSLFPKKAG
jgi:hypothetical protein